MVSVLEGKTMLPLYQGLKEKIAHRSGDRMTARDYLIQNVADLGIKAFAHEKPVAWGYFFLPQEMFAFFDAIDFMPEVWSSMLAAGSKDVKDLIDSGDGYLGANDP
ncbi:MAG: hypothetical protein HY675_15700 [Chloroflexi bacterium]|nr:hypothetical protein [Chloroflexota bacterium]